MNALQILAAQPWVERLGWTLVHFLWQGVALALLYAAARRAIGPKIGPNARYLLACAVLLAMLAAPLVTWNLLRPTDPAPDPAARIQSAPPSPGATGAFATTALPAAIRATVSSIPPAQFLPWVVIVWLSGAAVFWVRLVGGWVVAARMRSMLVRRAPPEWQESLGRLGARIGLARPVRLLVSALVQVPTVVGWLRPVVLAPVGALGGMPAEYLEALLLHELAHIRRHDYLINILQSVAEALLFYHPAVWWVSSHIRAERELCCDDVAVSVSGDAFTYASALAQLESYRPAHLAAAVAANGGALPDRIARLLGQSRPSVGAGLGPGVLAVAVLLVAAAYGLFAQSGAYPSFAVASIKPDPNHWSEPAQHPMGVAYRPGGRLTATNASLMMLIQFAYAVHDTPNALPLPASQVVGGPPWVNDPGYDIEAKPDANTDPKHAWLMLQTLLADRFKLALHRETRQLPVYTLTAAKSGLKLPAPKDIGCVSFPPGTPPRQVPGKVDCGHVFGPFPDSRGMKMRGNKVRLAELIRQLALVLDRPVLDRTGFTGEFDLDLTFTADESRKGMPNFGAPPGNPGPDIFAALDEQLGLKLMPAKGPVEVLVIDRAERPAEN